MVGKDVPYRLLEAIAELPESDLRQGLTRLQAAEFLYETNFSPDHEYTFKHGLTQEVAYNSVLTTMRILEKKGYFEQTPGRFERSNGRIGESCTTNAARQSR